MFEMNKFLMPLPRGFFVFSTYSEKKPSYLEIFWFQINLYLTLNYAYNSQFAFNELYSTLRFSPKGYFKLFPLLILFTLLSTLLLFVGLCKLNDL